MHQYHVSDLTGLSKQLVGGQCTLLLFRPARQQLLGVGRKICLGFCETHEMATLRWVHWYNHERLLSSIGYIPPAEAEANFHRQQASQAMAA